MTAEPTVETSPATAGDDLHALAMRIRYELTAAQGQLTELMRQIGVLKLEGRLGVSCPQCTIDCAGPRTLAEHTYQVHDGPLPEHLRAADELVVSDASEKNEGSE